MMQSATAMKAKAAGVMAVKYQMEEKTVVDQIEQAAAKGCTSVTISTDISQHITKQLRNAGYIVVTNSSTYQREPTTTTIRWD